MTTTVTPTFDLADRLRKSREMLGVDQATMADLIQVSRNSVSGWESRKHTPHPKNLRDWADATGVDVEWLVTHEYQTVRSDYDLAA